MKAGLDFAGNGANRNGNRAVGLVPMRAPKEAKPVAFQATVKDCHGPLGLASANHPWHLIGPFKPSAFELAWFAGILSENTNS